MNFKINNNEFKSSQKQKFELVFDDKQENIQKIKEVENNLLKYSDNILEMNEQTNEKKNFLL